MKKIFVALCCVMIGSAFGADDQSGRPNQADSVYDRNVFFENMMLAAEKMTINEIGSEEIQVLWKFVHVVCSKCVLQITTGGDEDIIELSEDCVRGAVKRMQKEMEKMKVVDGEMDAREQKCKLLASRCVDVCLNTALSWNGGYRKLGRVIERVCGVYYQVDVENVFLRVFESDSK